MANALLSWPNRIDETALSGGSWSASLPLSNLRSRYLGITARSASALTSATQFRATLPVARPVHVVALCRHNLSLAATVRIRVYSDAAATTLIHDSGAVYAWPAAYRTGAVPADNYSWRRWDFVYTIFATPAGTVGLGWGSNPIAWPSDTLTTSRTASSFAARAIQVDISDTANADGFVEIGRGFIGTSLQPARNAGYGASLAWEPRSQIAETLGGVEHFDEQQPRRVARFSLGNLSLGEGMSVFDLQGAAGVTSEVLYLWDPADGDNRLRRTFLGRMRALSQLEYPGPLINRATFEIQELL